MTLTYDLFTDRKPSVKQLEISLCLYKYTHEIIQTSLQRQFYYLFDSYIHNRFCFCTAKMSGIMRNINIPFVTEIFPKVS